MPLIRYSMRSYFSFLMLIKILLVSAILPSDTLIAEPDRLYFRGNQLVIPAALMIAGTAAEDNSRGSLKHQIADSRNRIMPAFRNRIDDYVQFAPFVALYGFEYLGMKPRTDVRNRTAIMLKAQILNLGLVYILKNSIGSRRPDGTTLSFPSGHTANVFAGAALVATEYGREHRWVPVVSYAVASGVGVMRMANNKHYISDVLFGAGLGILSVRTAYWLHQYKWTKSKSAFDPFEGTVY